MLCYDFVIKLICLEARHLLHLGIILYALYILERIVLFLLFFFINLLFVLLFLLLFIIFIKYKAVVRIIQKLVVVILALDYCLEVNCFVTSSTSILCLKY